MLPAPHEGAVIVAATQAPYAKRTHRPLVWFVAEVVRHALADAGLGSRDVDGLGLSSFQLSPDNVTTIAEQLGLRLSWAFQGAFGGASGLISVLRAARAIRDGEANVVVCAAADAFTVASHVALMDQFNSSMRDYLAPYGFGGTNGLFALVQRRHMYEFGTKREQIGRLAVTQRQHATLNPNALLRTPLSLDDYMHARVIAEPIRLYDCVMPCAGADAVVVVSENIAKRRGLRGVRILAGHERHNFRPDEVIHLHTGISEFSRDLFRVARVRHDQIDFLQLYDDYPIMEAIQIEDLGFCGKGEGGSFLESTDISRNGNLPINTGGGQLSAGQAGASGGMIGVYEAVAQLLHRAGDRQLQRAELGIVTGFGMVGYAQGLSSAAAILAA
jgi:acetyl-CoA acetyltransferase